MLRTFRHCYHMAMIPRRTVLQLPAAAGFSQVRPAGLRLSVRVEPLFPGMSLPRQMEKVAEAGYPGFEFGDWRAQDPVQISRLKNKFGLECVCIVGNRGVNPAGMGLCEPGERDGFLAEIRASAEAARRFETTGPSSRLRTRRSSSTTRRTIQER